MGNGSGTPPRFRGGRRSDDPEGYEALDADALGPDGPAQEAWLQMREITHPPAMLAAGGKLAEELGVTHGAIRALRPLASAGPMTMSGLAAHLRCDGSYVTGLIDTLEAAGLAERQNDASDRRVKVVVLTDRGREVASRACAVVFTPPDAFSALSARELDQLVRLLRKIRAAEAKA
ncbi:MAG: MarR family winged helix-turn-helix transcriptional regulator [Acidimicrobiales bacterium]